MHAGTRYHLFLNLIDRRLSGHGGILVCLGLRLGHYRVGLNFSMDVSLPGLIYVTLWLHLRSVDGRTEPSRVAVGLGKSEYETK